MGSHHNTATNNLRGEFDNPFVPVLSQRRFALSTSPPLHFFFLYACYFGWGNDCAYSFPVNHSQAQHSGGFDNPRSISACVPEAFALSTSFFFSFYACYFVESTAFFSLFLLLLLFMDTEIWGRKKNSMKTQDSHNFPDFPDLVSPDFIIWKKSDPGI